MLLNKILTIFLLTFSISILFVDSAFGCMCSRYPSVCEAYSKADAVIIGKVKEVEPEFVKLTDSNSLMWRRETIEVIKSFKGTEEKQIFLLTGATSCDWDFTPKMKEQTYLFYLSSTNQKNTYRAGVCGRSERIDQADDQLSWLNGLPESLKRTRFSGIISHYKNEPFTFVDYLVGTKVKIINDQHTFEAVTDQNGKYEIWDIPTGTYKIQPELPWDYKINSVRGRGSITYPEIILETVEEPEYSVEIKKNGLISTEYLVEIKPNGCAEMDYILNKKDSDK